MCVHFTEIETIQGRQAGHSSPEQFTGTIIFFPPSSREGHGCAVVWVGHPQVFTPRNPHQSIPCALHKRLQVAPNQDCLLCLGTLGPASQGAFCTIRCTQNTLLSFWATLEKIMFEREGTGKEEGIWRFSVTVSSRDKMALTQSS